MASLTYKNDIDGQTKTQNTEFFTADITPEKAGAFHFQLSFASDVAIQITLDSGSNWKNLNGGVTLGVDNLTTFTIFTKRGDTFNARIPTSGGSVVDVARVVEELV